MQNHDYSTFTSQIRDIHTHKENSPKNCLFRSVDRPKLSCLLLLPWCTAITGYHTSSDNNNNQQQLMAGYRQTSKLLMDTSQSRRAKFTTNSIYVCPRGAPIWHFADKQITDTQLQNIANKYNQSDILLYPSYK